MDLAKLTCFGAVPIESSDKRPSIDSLYRLRVAVLRGKHYYHLIIKGFNSSHGQIGTVGERLSLVPFGYFTFWQDCEMNPDTTKILHQTALAVPANLWPRLQAFHLLPLKGDELTEGLFVQRTVVLLAKGMMKETEIAQDRKTVAVIEGHSSAHYEALFERLRQKGVVQ